MKLSIIIPARNEENRIGHTLSETSKYLTAQNYESEIIVVVDKGSTDKTAELVSDFVRRTKNARLIVEPTHGKGGAVKIGVNHANGEYVMFMDADNATPISEIEKFWPHLPKFSVVIGSRYLPGSIVTHKQPLYRIILSRLSNILIQFVVAPGIKDTQLGFKAFTRDAALSIFRHITVLGWGFDMEVLTAARIQGYRIKEVPVLWREFGGSKVPLSAYIQSLKDLIKIKAKSLAGHYKETKKESRAEV